MNIFSCNLEIRSSHDINHIEFSGKSSFILDETLNISCPYGNKDTTITIENTDEKNIRITVSSKNISVKEEQGKYLEKIAILLSSVLGFKERNPYYGTPFITLNFQTFLSKNGGSAAGSALQLSDSDSIGVSESLIIEAITHVIFSDFDFASVNECELVKCYYNGLKAEGNKSKFFHFFLILEILEGCDLYKRMFPDGTLFTDSEKEDIRNFANSYSGAKRSSLLNCLSRTEKFRNEKLLSLIQSLGITELESVAGTCHIEQSTIRNITDARNKLFHKSENLNEGLLYYNLYPLVTQIVQKILKDPMSIS